MRETVYREEAGPLRVGVNASFSFDGSIKQLVQLAWGHSLHILPQEVRLDPAALVDTVRRQRIDVLDCTPSQLRPLLAAGLGDGGEDAAPALVLVGGEAVDADLRDAALARSRQGRTRFWNVYGPTECTVDTAATPFTAGAPPVAHRPAAAERPRPRRHGLRQPRPAGRFRRAPGSAAPASPAAISAGRT